MFFIRIITSIVVLKLNSSFFNIVIDVVWSFIMSFNVEKIKKIEKKFKNKYFNYLIYI